MHRRESNTNSIKPYIPYRARERKTAAETEYGDADTVENMYEDIFV